VSQLAFESPHPPLLVPSTADVLEQLQEAAKINPKYTITGAAAYLGVCVRTLRAHLTKGDGPAILSIGKKKKRVFRSELDKIMAGGIEMYFTHREAAAYLGITQAKLRDLQKDSAIDLVWIKVWGRILFPKEQFESIE
jgi:hypothetical protein